MTTDEVTSSRPARDPAAPEYIDPEAQPTKEIPFEHSDETGRRRLRELIGDQE